MLNESNLFTLPAPTGSCTEAFFQSALATVLQKVLIMPTQTLLPDLTSNALQQMCVYEQTGSCKLIVI